MDLLVKNSTIVTCDNEATIIRDGAVLGERIDPVGLSSDPERQYPHVHAIDAYGKAILLSHTIFHEFARLYAVKVCSFGTHQPSRYTPKL